MSDAERIIAHIPKREGGAEANQRPSRATKSNSDESTGAVLIDFTEIEAHRVKWLWPGRIARGKMTALSGRPKIGKGLLYTDLAARTTRGALGGDLDGPGHVIIVTTEDDPGDTLKPRLMAAGGDLSLVSMLQMGSRADRRGASRRTRPGPRRRLRGRGVNRYPATPAEFERLIAYLAPVAAERRPAIARMVFEEVGICPACGESVRRCDARMLRDGHLRHLACVGG